jgi:hypothetical protein
MPVNALRRIDLKYFLARSKATTLSLQAFEGSSYIGIIQNWKKPVAQEAFNAFVRLQN